MPPQTFRPSTKITRAVYILTAIVILVAVWAFLQYLPDQSPWLLAIPALLLLIPIRMHLRQLAVKLVVDAEHLVYEVGILSKQTRTLNILKVQDVTVVQSIPQRMLGLGDLRVETAGQGSAIVAENFDDPKGIAALILKTAHKDLQQHGL